MTEKSITTSLKSSASSMIPHSVFEWTTLSAPSFSCLFRCVSRGLYVQLANSHIRNSRTTGRICVDPFTVACRRSWSSRKARQAIGGAALPLLLTCSCCSCLTIYYSVPDWHKRRRFPLWAIVVLSIVGGALAVPAVGGIVLYATKCIRARKHQPIAL